MNKEKNLLVNSFLINFEINLTAEFLPLTDETRGRALISENESKVETFFHCTNDPGFYSVVAEDFV